MATAPTTVQHDRRVVGTVAETDSERSDGCPVMPQLRKAAYVGSIPFTRSASPLRALLRFTRGRLEKSSGLGGAVFPRLAPVSLLLFRRSSRRRPLNDLFRALQTAKKRPASIYELST